MDLKKDKRGIATIGLVFIILASFFAIVFIVALSYAMGVADDALSQLDGNISNDSIQEVYQNTLQPGILSMQTTVPQIMSTGVLFGMIISMLIVGYNVKRVKKIWILLDIFIIIIAESLAILVVSNFTNYISSNPAFVEIVRDTLPLASKYILNLPLLVPTIGVLLIVATHFTTKDKEEEEDLKSF